MSYQEYNLKGTWYSGIKAMPLGIQESRCVVLRECGDEDVTVVSLSCVDEYESYEPVQNSTVQKKRPRPINRHMPLDVRKVIHHYKITLDSKRIGGLIKGNVMTTICARELGEQSL